MPGTEDVTSRDILRLLQPRVLQTHSPRATMSTYEISSCLYIPCVRKRNYFTDLVGLCVVYTKINYFSDVVGLWALMRVYISDVVIRSCKKINYFSDVVGLFVRNSNNFSDVVGLSGRKINYFSDVVGLWA